MEEAVVYAFEVQLCACMWQIRFFGRSVIASLLDWTHAAQHDSHHDSITMTTFTSSEYNYALLLEKKTVYVYSERIQPENFTLWDLYLIVVINHCYVWIRQKSLQSVFPNEDTGIHFFSTNEVQMFPSLPPSLLLLSHSFRLFWTSFGLVQKWPLKLGLRFVAH